MPEPSFIAPVVPRTADERWHVRAELREAVGRSTMYALTVLVGLLVRSATEARF